MGDIKSKKDRGVPSHSRGPLKGLHGRSVGDGLIPRTARESISISGAGGTCLVKA